MPHTFLKSACRLRASHWTLVTFCYLVLAGVVLGQGKGAVRGTVEDFLDARNFFAETRPPSDREIAEVELDGPLSNRVRLLLAGRYFPSDDTSVVHAHTPTDLLVANVDVPEHNTRLFGRLEFDLTPKHTLTFIYNFKNKDQQNLGIHSFDLAERATDFSIHESEVKVFERAILSPRFLNDLRLGYKDEPQQTTSLSNQQAILVFGAQARGLGARVLTCVEDASAFINAADLVITRAGYNSLCEVISLKKKALVMPRLGPRAEQRMRAELFQQKGLIDVLDPREVSPRNLAQRIVDDLERTDLPIANAAIDMSGARNAARRLSGLVLERASLQPMTVSASQTVGGLSAKRAASGERDE